MRVTKANKQVVQRYFASVTSGEGNPLDCLAEDVTWWVPQGSSLGGIYRGKAAVAELMGSALDAYSDEIPMEIEIRQLVAEDDWVCAQVEISAGTRDGRPYRNWYHWAFRVRDGQIVEVNEYVDTRYVHETLGI